MSLPREPKGAPHYVYSSMEELTADIRRWRQDHPVRYRYGRIKARTQEVWSKRHVPLFVRQRARRGYSERDLWSFDAYICGVIGNGVRDLRAIKHGYPAHMTPEEWDAVLGRISDPLLDYAEHHLDLSEGYEVMTARHDAAREALHPFAENLGSMWD
ncbi:hypothetical protein [Streptomyces sp. gCLA4]|uniref:hypothetical protein n=1 Tax=Streptomyces sp. gCLA4 TaxID=1873416 RepID=UPI0016032677|nr:hypothetical protein [Streptomyces sp. gCLA4]